MRYVYVIAGLVVLATSGLSMFARLAEMDPTIWHADPFAAERTGRPNDYLLAEGGDADVLRLDLEPAEAVARFDAVAMADKRVSRLAGDVEAGWVTYIQRSALIGYPDAISVRALPEGDGSRLAIWSRSRFGHSDLGVNAARVTRWLGLSGLGS